jgi:hypothetical protein
MHGLRTPNDERALKAIKCWSAKPESELTPVIALFSFFDLRQSEELSRQ